MVFGTSEIIGITSVGIAAFAANQVLHYVDRPDLAKTLDISVGISALLFVVYKLVDGLKVVSTIFVL